MIIALDKRVYNDSVISKVVYWLSGDYIINRTALSEFKEEIEVILTNREHIDSEVKEKFFRLLNDYKLRQIVADETRAIKTILYAKAFADDEELSEEDIHD